MGSFKDHIEELKGLNDKPSYPIILNEALIGSARSEKEAIHKVSEYATERYGWRYADGRNLIAIAQASLDHLMRELNHTPTTATIHCVKYEAEIGIEKRIVWLISVQSKPLEM